MKDIFKSLKVMEAIFLILAGILISPLCIEFLLITIVPLAVVGIIPSILAFKERKFYITILNILVVIGSAALYLYLW